MSAGPNGYPTLSDVVELFAKIGKHPVFLHINAKEKGPKWKGWPETTYEQMLDSEYQHLLCSKPNTGVLLGEPSEDLCTLDCDTNAFLGAYLEAFPVFKTTLLTRGEQGGQFWFYATGERPRSVQSLKVHKDSPLAVGAKKPLDKDGKPLEYVQIGEFRCDGGQSIIRGIHPTPIEDNGDRYYTWLQVFPPITISFDQIPWLNDIVIPWGKNRRATVARKSGNAEQQQFDADKELLRRAIAALSIDFLWSHFGFEPRQENPVHSPFRIANPSSRPSFSVYDEAHRFKDHDTDYPEYHGDSYDFYQFATGKDSHAAFEPFVELAGFGAELNNGAEAESENAQACDPEDFLQKFATYYDPDRSCYWTKNDRASWIKVSGDDVSRHLQELGYKSRARKGEACSETARILNRIQKTMDVDYAASLAGYHKGILEYRGRRLLILDSPVFVTPAPGDWTLLAGFLVNLLGLEQLPYFYGWLKIALEALYAGKFRPGQALVLAGPKDCGKSLLQNLLTVLFGGRSAKPHQYMSGATDFNGDLFCAEHLMMEDEEPATDIRARRNLGTKIKEVTANVTQRCHHKYRTGLTLEPFWRLTISLNDETENLLILPPWDDSIEDKIILLKASPAKMPMPSVTDKERAAFWAALVATLPAFVDALFKAEIPKKLFSHRYGVTHFHHPEILEALGALAPETRFLELIDAEIFKCIIPIGRRTTPWEGTASALELNLTGDTSDVRHAARKLLSWQGACGTYLGRLQRMRPKRVSFHRGHRERVWSLNPPEDDPPENV